MIDCGKRAIFGVDVSVIDYEAAVSRVIEAARTGAPLAVSALAVHEMDDRRIRYDPPLSP